MTRVLLCLVFVLLGAPLRADTERATYDAVLLGLPVGRLEVAWRLEDSTDAASAAFRAAGLARLVSSGVYAGSSEGTRRAGRLIPGAVETERDFGRRPFKVRMRYADGVPEILSLSPDTARYRRLDPATQGGTLDPVSFAVAFLRPVPATEACGRQFELFDGARRSRIEVGPALREGGVLRCTGRYVRVDGYTPEELAERTEYAFSAVFAAVAGGQVRLVEVDFDSLLGPAALRLRSE